MPRKVGRLHEHMLPTKENQDAGDVWSCDCGTLFFVQSNASGEKEWALVSDPTAAGVDFIEEEKVEAPVEEAGTEESKPAEEA